VPFRTVDWKDSTVPGAAAFAELAAETISDAETEIASDPTASLPTASAATQSAT